MVELAERNEPGREWQSLHGIATARRRRHRDYGPSPEGGSGQLIIRSAIERRLAGQKDHEIRRSRLRRTCSFVYTTFDRAPGQNVRRATVEVVKEMRMLYEKRDPSSFRMGDFFVRHCWPAGHECR